MKPTLDEVDDAVDRWHADDSDGDGLTLYEYLGWTKEEYVAWVYNATLIPDRPLRNWDDVRPRTGKANDNTDS